MKRFLLFAAFLFSLRATAADSAKQLLEAQFQNKVFFIRGFYRDDKLVYDAQGNVQGTPKVGPWTLAPVHIDKVDVRGAEFVLEGKRAAEYYDPEKRQFITTVPRNAEDVKIKVKAAADSLSDAALEALSDRIFEAAVHDDEVPEWWRDFFHGQTKTAWKRPVGDNGDGKAIPTVEFGEPVYRPGQGRVVPPRLTYKPDPKYQEIARQARYEGVTVLDLILSKEGVPEHLRVVRPLGMGLDDNAVETVRSWRFAPATLDGKPVFVFISVEVAFRLY